MFRKILLLLSFLIGFVSFAVHGAEDRREVPLLLSGVGWESYGASHASGDAMGRSSEVSAGPADEEVERTKRARSPKEVVGSSREPFSHVGAGSSSVTAAVVVGSGGATAAFMPSHALSGSRGKGSVGVEARAARVTAGPGGHHGLIADLSALKHHIKQYLHEDGVKTENCFDKHFDGSNKVPNIAFVRVFYATRDGLIHHREIPYIFVSGWKDEGKIDIKHFSHPDSENALYEPRYIGDFYDIGGGETIGIVSAGAVKAKHPGAATLVSDFLERGIRIKADATFSSQTYAHSEQAFISYLQNDPGAIISPSDQPTSIVLYIMSTRDPCGHCQPLLRNFIGNSAVKAGLLSKIFPSIGDTSHVPLNIIYGSYMKFPRSNATVPQHIDLIDSIVDFSQWKYYILVRQTLGGGK